MAYQHILNAYDGSDLARKALEQAVGFVNEHPATRLTVLHVYNYPNLLVGDILYSIPPGAEQEYYDYAEGLIEDARKAIEGLPFASVEMREGFPADQILRCAEERGCDLIMMGSRGLSGLRELVLGSVSHAVVQKAKVPVMIVKAEGPILKEGGIPA